MSCFQWGYKPKKYLKNWCPISLLNTSYKAGATAVTNRTKKILPSVISFVVGRYIEEETRVICDLMEHTETFQMSGLLLLIDFEKASILVDRKYFLNVLSFFNFGPSISHWIEIFYNESRVNGFVSPSFNMGRGCCQGDPISPYIFIYCVEILGFISRNIREIKGN